ncbi:fibronectin type III domain-containing protein, partial [Halorubrum lacusprofundi]|uniref:fibronectin type III domain-containing protein n=1 Tax=Halorubrum lacusprofundi TaxID=2247 RepID=UPI00197B015A
NSHRFRVRAESAGDEGGWAYTETVDTDPSNLSVTTVASREMGLVWDGIRDANDYEILRAESTGSNPLDYSPVGTTGGLTTFTDTSLEDGERYYYRVRAVYPGTDSQPTNEVDATTPLPTPALDALDTATAREIVEYTLTDNSSDGDLTIGRSDNGGATCTTVATITHLSTTVYHVIDELDRIDSP